MQITVNQRLGTIKQFFFLFLYRGLLDFCYTEYISEKFSYVLMTFDFNLFKYLLSWIVYLFFIKYIAQLSKSRDCGSAVLYILSLVSLIPTTSFLGLAKISYVFFFYIIIYWSVLFFAYKYVKKIPTIKVQGRFLLPLLFIILAASVIYVSGKYFGFRFHFSLLNVYDLREEEGELRLPIILDYIFAAAKTVLPFFTVYFLFHKRYILSILTTIIILLNFGIGGHKSVLFLLLLAISGFLLFRFNKIHYTPIILSSIIVLAIFEEIILNTFFIGAMGVQRVLFVPSQLSFLFYDFFSNRELLLFRQGPLAKLGLESPYDSPVEFIIGGLYFNDDSIRANNGLFSDAYSNLGFIGIFIFPFVLAIFFKLVNACTSNINERLLFIPIIAISITLLSASFTTSLLTSGLLLMVFILAISNYNKI